MKQQIKNKLAIRALNKAQKITDRPEIKEFIECSNDKLKQGNSNVTSEELEQLYRFDDMELLSNEDIRKRLNVSFRTFREKFLKLFRRKKIRGTYLAVDLDMLEEELKNKPK